MRALFCAVLVALPVACVAPSLASAQYAQPQPYRGDPRWGRPPTWLGESQAAEAAQALAHRATRLSRVIQRIEGYSELSGRAQEFARAANIFARSLDSGAPYGRLMQSYEELQREYQDLRGAFFAQHRTHHVEGVVDDWTALVSSFERLSLDLGVEESQLCSIEPGRRYGRRYDDYDNRQYGYDPRYDRVPG
jgi:hypothetical protein